MPILFYYLQINEGVDEEYGQGDDGAYIDATGHIVKDVPDEKSDSCSVDANVPNVTQPVQFYTEDLHNGRVHIEVLAVPSGGRPVTPQNLRHGGTSVDQLTKSETWHFSPGDEKSGVPYLDLRKRAQSPFNKASLKPENYCFHCLPDNMSTKVGRSAGRMPARTQSASAQVLRMARRQNEYFKKAPPVRTPPSIPRPHHQGRGQETPRQGEVYNRELEHHARRTKSPRHFMEQGKAGISWFQFPLVCVWIVIIKFVCSLKELFSLC